MGDIIIFTLGLMAPVWVFSGLILAYLDEDLPGTRAHWVGSLIFSFFITLWEMCSRWGYDFEICLNL